ncbi:MAG: RNA polymerase sigma factor, partial [Polyangiales bacterium]
PLLAQGPKQLSAGWRWRRGDFDMTVMDPAVCFPLPYWPGTATQEAPRAHREGTALDEQTVRATAAMDRYARGDSAAFEELYRLLSPRLYRLCTYLAGREDADELLQEVFLKLHRARASFVPGGSVVAWSYAIARTTQLDRLRRRKRRPEAPLEAAQLETRAAQPGSDPESAAAQRALEAVFEKELGELSETLRAAYVMVKLEGLGCAEAASVLGVSTSAIKQRVHRASEQLKAALQASGWWSAAAVALPDTQDV